MRLSDTNWIDFLSKRHSPSRETVIIVVGNKLPRSLRIRKEDWRNHFSEFGGIGFKRGEGIEIVPEADGGPKAAIPDWARESLASGSGDAICITQRDGRYYLKGLELVEQLTEVSSCIVIDRFEAHRVERTYWNRTELEQFTYETVDRLLSSMPRFRYDPVAPFKDMNGRIGFLARKEFFGGFTRSDEAAIQDYKKELCQDQQENGSWEESAAKTAFKLIRLLEVGATIEEGPVEKAASWLLNAKEPLGLPGLFMFSEGTAESFSNWKQKQEPGSRKRGSRSSTIGQRRAFVENWDVVGPSNAYCEVKLTWTSAIALEALLRCGLHSEDRVVKAINTLLSMGPSGGWCGCGYFVANIYHEASTAPVDFSIVPISVKGRSPGSVGVERDDILEMACNHRYKGLSIGEKEALVARAGAEGSGDCPLMVHKALSYHPAYHDSNLEIMGALHCSRRQGWLGDWTGNYVPFFFMLLSRFRCPLSAFLVLRTVPWLVRQQRPDGFWQEEPLPSEPKKPLPVPAKEEGTLMILTALKTFGFLDALRSF
jgi:hypothetical protein